MITDTFLWLFESSSYRNLLDRWQLWHARANFDIERGQRMSNSNEIVPPQVYVRCTFCSQSLGHSLLIQNIRNREGKRVNLQANVSPVSSGGGRTFGRQKVIIFISTSFSSQS